MTKKTLTKKIVPFVLFLAILLALPLQIYGTDSTEGITITTPSHHLTIGSSVTMSATTNPIGLYVYWYSENTSVATVNSNGVVTGVSAGTANIVAHSYNPATSSTLIKIVTVTVHDDPIGLTDDTTYYLLNHGYDKVMTTGGASDINYTNVYATTRDTSTATQWRLDILPDGMAQLISVGSATNKCLTVNGTNLCICTNTQSANQKFIIERSETQFYEGYYLIRYGDMYVACYSDYNVYLVSGVVRRAYWSISKVEKGDADLFSFDYTGFDTTANNELFETTMTTAGYNAYSWENDPASDAYEYLYDTDDIFVFHGHGNSGMIAFKDDDGSRYGGIFVNNAVGDMFYPRADQYCIDALPENSLSNLRVVLYIGCFTGADRTINGVTYNLVDSTYEKGAHYVLGTTHELYVSDNNNFLSGFLTASQQGLNVSQCIQAAKAAAGNNVWRKDKNDVVTYGSYPIYEIGDKKQYLD